MEKLRIIKYVIDSDFFIKIHIDFHINVSLKDAMKFLQK